MNVTAARNRPLALLLLALAVSLLPACGVYRINIQQGNYLEEETIDQVVRLSIRYGIVTEYTSYLVTEPKALGSNAWEDIAEEEYDRSFSAPTAPSYGQDAVEKAAGQGAMAEAEMSKVRAKQPYHFLQYGQIPQWMTHQNPCLRSCHPQAQMV